MDIEVLKNRGGHFCLWDGSRFLADCGKGPEGEERATAIWDKIKNLQAANEALQNQTRPTRTAIAPFARLYEAARGLVGEDWVVGRVNDATGEVFEVTMGDLRRLVGEMDNGE
jgi:hypothetical protein